MIELKTPNFYSREGRKPKALVLHITDCDLQSALSYTLNPASQASYHYIIGKKNGVVNVYKMVDEEQAAWHTGKVVRPTWNGLEFEPDGRIINPNKYTLGVAVALKAGEFPSWNLWLEWVRLVKDICDRYGFKRDENDLVNHFEIRIDKTCPRPWCNRAFANILIKYFIDSPLGRRRNNN